VVIDFKDYLLDPDALPKARPARQLGAIRIKGPFYPAMPWAWFNAVTEALPSSSRVRVAARLYRRWVMLNRGKEQHPEPIPFTAQLVGGSAGNARRRRAAALGDLVAAGLVEIVEPARGRRAPRVRPIFPPNPWPTEGNESEEIACHP
jgi:hypothetical protein